MMLTSHSYGGILQLEEEVALAGECSRRCSSAWADVLRLPPNQPVALLKAMLVVPSVFCSLRGETEDKLPPVSMLPDGRPAWGHLLKCLKKVSHGHGETVTLPELRMVLHRLVGHVHEQQQRCAAYSVWALWLAAALLVLVCLGLLVPGAAILFMLLPALTLGPALGVLVLLDMDESAALRQMWCSPTLAHSRVVAAAQAATGRVAHAALTAATVAIEPRLPCEAAAALRGALTRLTAAMGTAHLARGSPRPPHVTLALAAQLRAILALPDAEVTEEDVAPLYLQLDGDEVKHELELDAEGEDSGRENRTLSRVVTVGGANGIPYVSAIPAPPAVPSNLIMSMVPELDPGTPPSTRSGYAHHQGSYDTGHGRPLAGSTASRAGHAGELFPEGRVSQEMRDQEHHTGELAFSQGGAGRSWISAPPSPASQPLSTVVSLPQQGGIDPDSADASGEHVVSADAVLIPARSVGPATAGPGPAPHRMSRRARAAAAAAAARAAKEGQRVLGWRARGGLQQAQPGRALNRPGVPDLYFIENLPPDAGDEEEEEDEDDDHDNGGGASGAAHRAGDGDWSLSLDSMPPGRASGGTPGAPGTMISQLSGNANSRLSPRPSPLRGSMDWLSSKAAALVPDFVARLQSKDPPPAAAVQQTGATETNGRGSFEWSIPAAVPGTSGGGQQQQPGCRNGGVAVADDTQTKAPDMTDKLQRTSQQSQGMGRSLVRLLGCAGRQAVKHD